LRRRIGRNDPAPLIRRRRLPDRIVGDQIVVVRPGVDDAVVLGGAAALVWLELDDWTTETDLSSAVAVSHPEVDEGC
jgi:hypothetical protein